MALNLNEDLSAFSIEEGLVRLLQRRFQAETSFLVVVVDAFIVAGVPSNLTADSSLLLLSAFPEPASLQATNVGALGTAKPLSRKDFTTSLEKAYPRFSLMLTAIPDLGDSDAVVLVQDVGGSAVRVLEEQEVSDSKGSASMQCISFQTASGSKGTCVGWCAKFGSYSSATQCKISSSKRKAALDPPCPHWGLIAANSLPVPLLAPVNESDKAKLLKALGLPLFLSPRPLAFPAESSASWTSWLAGFRSNPTPKRPTDLQLQAKWAALSPKSVKALVEDPVEYWHYKCDGFDDSGWGCAYRSLQTVLSWFRLQGARVDEIPSVTTIQKILAVVDSSAKKPSFVGSKDWIGSFEVMMVLQHFMPQLECTILRLESGSDLQSPENIRKLLNHFQRGGPPIMIGGASYAHTIVGIDADVSTCQCQLLIFDPHYPSTTTEVQTVFKKGWIEWKDPSKFFQQEKWYNLCIPQVQ
jgi:hypothetical protein